MPPTLIVRQMSHPRGMLGTLVRHIMNSRNADVNSLALQSMAITSSDRILEVGFGGGPNLPALLHSASFVAGLDRSSNVVNTANARYRRAIEDDRAEFRLGLVELLPYESGYFDKICAVHGPQFWKNLAKPFAELFRALAPRGRVLLAFHTKEHLERRYSCPGIVYPRTSEEICQALAKTGFHSIHVTKAANSPTCQLVTAQK
jgi:arsenite methyltransferase